jgi:hypothetical protein
MANVSSDITPCGSSKNRRFGEHGVSMFCQSVISEKTLVVLKIRLKCTKGNVAIGYRRT